MIRIKSPQNLAAGVLFIVIGIAGVWLAKDLTYGSARNMGPGFFPTWLSWMIGAMGLANVVRSTVLTGPAIEAFQWRPIFFVCLGALIFGWFIEHIGLALALVVMTMVAVQARRDTRQGQLLILSVVMAVLSVVVFVYILKQGMPAWWGR